MIRVFLALLLLAPVSARAEEDVLRRVLEILADPALEGRALDSAGSAAARDLLVPTMREVIGLEPWKGTFEHPFPAGDRTGVNLVGALPGTAEGIVVLGAHYDGQGSTPEVHPSADDNASGVAAVLVAAGVLADLQPDRTVVVAFFDGEEEGLLGSRAFLAEGVVDASSIVAMVNLDTVGRPEGDTLTVFGASSGSRLPEALRGINTVMGFDLALATQGAGASDDAAFREMGIPAVQLFGHPHADYHRPTDTADKIDTDFLHRVSVFTSELVDYLARADTQVDFVPAGAADVQADASRQTQGRRRVSFGSIPDFQFAGEGVKLTGVLPGSPAAEAGVQAGDILVSFGGVEVVDLTGYSEAMKRFAPGDEVEVVLRRGGETVTVTATLRARD